MIQAKTALIYAIELKIYCERHSCKKCPFCRREDDIKNYCRLIRVMPEDWPVDKREIRSK